MANQGGTSKALRLQEKRSMVCSHYWGGLRAFFLDGRIELHTIISLTKWRGAAGIHGSRQFEAKARKREKRRNAAQRNTQAPMINMKYPARDQADHSIVPRVKSFFHAGAPTARTPKRRKYTIMRAFRRLRFFIAWSLLAMRLIPSLTHDFYSKHKPGERAF
jgi:hypothetical protein